MIKYKFSSLEKSWERKIWESPGRILEFFLNRTFLQRINIMHNSDQETHVHDVDYIMESIEIVAAFSSCKGGATSFVI